jgi:hypothetical protein
VAEASHNRVLWVQLISLQHVSWPRRNPTLTPKVARRIVEVHKELLALIEIRDPSGARRLMNDHVKMIRARRVSEHAKSEPRPLVPAQSGRRPFVPAKAGTQDNKPKSSSKRPLGSRLRGNERRLRIDTGNDDETGCC